MDRDRVLELGPWPCPYTWTVTVSWNLDRDRVLELGPWPCPGTWTVTVSLHLDRDPVLELEPCAWWVDYKIKRPKVMTGKKRETRRGTHTKGASDRRRCIAVWCWDFCSFSCRIRCSNNKLPKIPNKYPVTVAGCGNFQHLETGIHWSSFEKKPRTTLIKTLWPWPWPWPSVGPANTSEHTRNEAG